MEEFIFLSYERIALYVDINKYLNPTGVQKRNVAEWKILEQLLIVSAHALRLRHAYLLYVYDRLTYLSLYFRFNITPQTQPAWYATRNMQFFKLEHMYVRVRCGRSCITTHSCFRHQNQHYVVPLFVRILVSPSVWCQRAESLEAQNEMEIKTSCEMKVQLSYTH